MKLPKFLKQLSAPKIYIRRVVGESMFPTLQPFQVCVFLSAKKWQDGDIMLIRIGEREMVKRLFLIGDIIHARGDSHHSGNYIIKEPDIKAKLMFPKVN